MNQAGAAEDLLLVALETGGFPPIRKLQEAAADALGPRYAFFLFPPAFPLQGGIPKDASLLSLLRVLFLFP